MSDVNNEPQSVENEDGDKKVDSDNDDEDLDALLDDALEGFDKPIPSSKPKPEEIKPTEVSQADMGWSEEFMKQAATEFEKNIRMMMAESASSGEDTDFSENLLRVSQEAASKVFETQSGDGGASFAETLRSLAESAESLQGEPDEATLAKMLEKMAFGEDGNLGGFDGGASGEMGGLGELLPAMQGMLQSLLSKELLYPSIKEIVGKYPEWLADNRSKIDSKEFDKYNRQFSIMQQVCTEFEDEKDTDDATKKNTRFEKILTLMQQMQECGHPPKELAGEAEFAGLPTNPFGADFGQAMGGAGPENCVLM